MEELHPAYEEDQEEDVRCLSSESGEESCYKSYVACEQVHGNDNCVRDDNTVEPYCLGECMLEGDSNTADDKLRVQEKGEVEEEEQKDSRGCPVC